MQIIFDEIELILRLGLDVPQPEEPFRKSEVLLTPPKTYSVKFLFLDKKKQGLFMLSLPLHFQYIPKSISPRFGQSDCGRIKDQQGYLKRKLAGKLHFT